MALSMRESSWRTALVERICLDLPEGGVAADVGSGTGTFAIELATIRLDASVIGVDGDPKSMAIAKSKPGSDRVRWDEGLAADLPLADDSVDVVSMSLLLHHLIPEAKASALVEAERVLRPGGCLHVADWGKPDAITFAGFQLLRVLDGVVNTRDHARGGIPKLVGAAGFDDVSVWRTLRTVWGSMEFISAAKPR
ncbi:MAG: methyltransferase domain-containing protein [Verrucomicrobiae bacterium]|nr:methyltransferase domain-containing protein [Verrucomicrobiae bacterium]